MKIAIVHDELVQGGGAERLLLLMHEVWPDAPVYTSIYAPENLPPEFRKVDIRTSFMQRLPFSKGLRRQYLPLYPFAFESFDFSEFDVVLSSSTRFAHGVITKPKTLHISYSNSPSRFLWETPKYLERENIGVLGRLLLSPILSYLRIWDQTAVQRPDFWIANSKNVAGKLKKFYRKDSAVIYPGVDVNKFKMEAKPPYSVAQNAKLKMKNDYFLIVTRLLPWKRVDLAVGVCSRLELPLIVVGDGPDAKRLKKFASRSVRFLGNVSEDKLAAIYRGARALIMTQAEDFGIAALEAQAAGVPVIAYGEGGAKETVLAGETGLYFNPQTEDVLKDALRKFEKMEFSPHDCMKNAQKFSIEKFKESLKSFVKEKYQQW